MRYAEVIKEIIDIEIELNLSEIKYGLYSVDKHSYFRDIQPSNHGEVSFVFNPLRFEYSKPKIDNIKQYLLNHNGRIYFPAHQLNYRHGIMVQVDLLEIYNTLDIIDNYIQEPTGQLAFVL